MDLNQNDLSLTKQSSDQGALSSELARNQNEEKNRSYLASFVLSISEGFHGSKGAAQNLEGLKAKLDFSNLSGDAAGAGKLKGEIAAAIEKNQDSRKLAGSIANHSTGFIKSLGLFFPGRAGYALSMMSSAADASRPADSLVQQGGDFILGASKGAALKLSFDKIGASQMNLAAKALTMSYSNRLAELGLNSHSYVDQKTGKFSFAAGGEKIFSGMTDTQQLGTDLAAFGGGYLLLKRMGVSPDLARSNPILAQSIAGGGFGFSSGFFADLQTQKRLNPSGGVDLSSALKSGALQMSLDASAAALGGWRLQQMRSGRISADEGSRAALTNESVLSASQRSLSRLDGHVEAVLGLDPRPIARPHSELTVSSMLKSPDAALAAAELASIAKPGASGGLNISKGGPVREFMALDNVSALMEKLQGQGANAEALVRVKEITNASGSPGSGALGPERTLLIRHLDPAVKSAIDIKSAKFDLLACCSPGLLKSAANPDLRARHIFPDAGSSPVFLQVPGSNKLRFVLKEALSDPKLGSQPSLELGAKVVLGERRLPPGKAGLIESELARGMTVSEWLDSLSKIHRLQDMHDVQLMARAFADLKVPIKRYLGGGADSIAFEIQASHAANLRNFPAEIKGSIQSGLQKPEGTYVLKLTDKPSSSQWGGRTLSLHDGQIVQFDAPMVGARQEVRFGDQTLSYYLQPKGVTPVQLEHLRYFSRLLDADRKYVFWDNDMSSWGQGQLAYVPLTRSSNGLLSGIPLKDGKTGLVLIDYDAVRLIGQEPKQSSAGSWRYGNYDFIPFDK